MKRHILIIAMVFVGFMLHSCVININSESVKGDGNVVAREYDIDQFDEIVCALPATVNFSVGEEYSCTIRVDENLLEYIDIKAKGGELVLGQVKPKDGLYVGFSATEFVIDITAPDINEITLAGSGDINILSPLNVQDLEITVAGSGDITFSEEVDINHLELSVNGSGDIHVEKGTVHELEADIAGSGDIVSHAEAQEAEVSVIGSGDITVNVTGTLDYRIVGSGDIYYYGDAKVTGKITGSGDITPVERPSR